VLWAIVPRKAGGEGPLPIDPDPTPDGNLFVFTRGLGNETQLRGRYIAKGEPWPDGSVKRVSHFKTCPNASQHSRSGK
jgi:hypothetical protein